MKRLIISLVIVVVGLLATALDTIVQALLAVKLGATSTGKALRETWA